MSTTADEPSGNQRPDAVQLGQDGAGATRSAICRFISASSASMVSIRWPTATQIGADTVIADISVSTDWTCSAGQFGDVVMAASVSPPSSVWARFARALAPRSGLRGSRAGRGGPRQCRRSAAPLPPRLAGGGPGDGPPLPGRSCPIPRRPAAAPDGYRTTERCQNRPRCWKLPTQPAVASIIATASVSLGVYPGEQSRPSSSMGPRSPRRATL
jgi:hypothetical protein